jgi:glycosyltransferase involved in cell wall biosynthesis
MIVSEIEIFRTLARFASKGDTVHIDVGPWQSWILLSALVIILRLNVFVTLHNVPITTARWRKTVWKARMKFLSRLSGFRIFASNQHTRNNILPLVDAKAWERIPVTTTAVDSCEIDRVLSARQPATEIRLRLGLDITSFLIVCVGNFIDRKGRRIFLEAARLLRDRYTNLQWAWITAMAPTSEDIGLINSYALGDRFSLISSREIGSREDLLALVRSSDIFALPSYVEGLPIALLEAMALGVASISTNVYAIPEAVLNGETGILIEAGDAEALASAVSHLHEDSGFRLRLSQNASKYVLDRFTEKASAAIAIAAYEDGAAA